MKVLKATYECRKMSEEVRVNITLLNVDGIPITLHLKRGNLIAPCMMRGGLSLEMRGSQLNLFEQWPLLASN
jgi:hypothetical protein